MFRTKEFGAFLSFVTSHCLKNFQLDDCGLSSALRDFHISLHQTKRVAECLLLVCLFPNQSIISTQSHNDVSVLVKIKTELVHQDLINI